MDLWEKRVFEAPQNLVDSAGHEHLNTKTVHVHRNQGSQKEGVGVQLGHHRLRTKVKKRVIKTMEGLASITPQFSLLYMMSFWVIKTWPHIIEVCVFKISKCHNKTKKTMAWSEGNISVCEKIKTHMPIKWLTLYSNWLLQVTITHVYPVQTSWLTTNGMLTVFTMSTSGSPADFSGTNTKVLGFRA